MHDGMDFDLLVQLTFAFEGFSVWKIKTPKTSDPNFKQRNQAVIKKIFNGSGDDSPRMGKALLFAAVSFFCKWLEGIARFFLSLIPATLWGLCFIIFPLAFDVKNNNAAAATKTLNIVLFLYFLVKMTVYFLAWLFSKWYDFLVRSVSGVDVKDSGVPQGISAVESK